MTDQQPQTSSYLNGLLLAAAVFAAIWLAYQFLA
jgi:hypothetical protein